jgi:uncharacterized protein
MKSNPMTAFWRFWLTQVVFALAIAIAIRLIVAIPDGAELPKFFSRAIGLSIGVATLVGLGRIGWVQGINGLQPPNPARGLLLGAVTGTVLYSGIVLVAALAGWYAVQSISFDLAAFLGGFGLLVLAGAFEEILFQGVLFQPLETAIGTGWALALSGTFFGALHLGNTNTTVIGAIAVGLAGVALAGVALAAVFAWTRDLWLLTGLHVMWNFMQGSIFGVAVSGNAFSGLIQPRIQGPEVFTGGAFGFEAGAITVALCLVSTVWLVQRTRGAERWQRLGKHG